MTLNSGGYNHHGGLKTLKAKMRKNHGQQGDYSAEFPQQGVRSVRSHGRKPDRAGMF
jgi:hypothetical protein